MCVKSWYVEPESFDTLPLYGVYRPVVEAMTAGRRVIGDISDPMTNVLNIEDWARVERK
jgi:hypothetical protein